ncbi:hypothetical protein [Allomuricauda sp. ARW1Y1]|jgi:hypothetical protein|uniref:hypothetical protein n=1 Tax=Allomuricauda sp. ARW1Y1 TaxID=2663843 RepID=UPI0015C81140|nr:hypothetical protein [Muricauda sp. ARW1Y1]NYJ26339.1 hypothetical protein [Muricauda sp. ARW1Y1]
MKTQITKENAVKILESIVRQQVLCDSLSKLLDSDMQEFYPSYDVFEALFNIDFMELPQESYCKYSNAFTENAKVENGKYKLAAERIYDAMVALDNTKFEPGAMVLKMAHEDALKVIGSHLMSYVFYAKISDIGLDADNYLCSYSQLLKILFANVPSDIQEDDLMEVFYKGADDLIATHDFRHEVPNELLREFSNSIYRGLIKKGKEQLV